MADTVRSTAEALGLLDAVNPVDPVSRIDFSHQPPYDRPLFRERERQFLRDLLVSYESIRGVFINVKDAPFYAMGNGVDDDTAAIQAAFNSIPATGGAVLFPSVGNTANYKITGNLTVKARTRLYSDGRAVLKGVGAVWAITALGSLTGLATTITASINRSDKNIAVTSTAGFVAGDSIELTGSTGATSEAQNSLLGPQRELNEVDTVTDGTHLKLKYPAAHDYTYNAAYTTQGGVAKVTPIDDVTIDGLDFETSQVVHGYNRRFQISDVRFSNQGILTSVDTSSLHSNIDIEVTAAVAGAGANANAYLYGQRFFRANIKSFGGHSDGVRMYGCADGTYSVNVQEAVARGINLYKCQTVSTPWSEVQGSQPGGTTNEGVLFNFSYDCNFTGLLDERVKLSSIVEFRGNSRNCWVINSTVHCAYTYPITWKGLSVDCGVRGGTWYSYYNGSAGYLVDLQIDTDVYPSLTIDGPRLISKSPNTGFGVLRTVGTTVANTAANSIITLRNIVYDRGASNLLGLTGTEAGQPITRLTVENCHSASDDAGNGALAICQLPVTNLRFNNVTLARGTTRIIQLLSGTITNLYVYGVDALTLQVGANVLNMWLGDNALSTYTIPSLAQVKGGIINGVAAIDFASIAAGQAGEVAITVTGIVAGDYITAFCPGALPAGLVLGQPIAATDSIKFRLFNGTAGAIDPANATYGWQLVRRG